MARKRDDRGGELRCSFCGKSQDEVKKLIAGPTVYICDECVELCNDIIAEEYEREGAARATQIPKPSECYADDRRSEGAEGSRFARYAAPEIVDARARDGPQDELEFGIEIRGRAHVPERLSLLAIDEITAPVEVAP